jgi:hypothetical protein
MVDSSEKVAIIVIGNRTTLIDCCITIRISDVVNMLELKKNDLRLQLKKN